MKYIYHCHVIHQHSLGQITHFDGLITTSMPITNTDEYQNLKSNLATAAFSPPPRDASEIIINSLTLLHTLSGEEAAKCE